MTTARVFRTVSRTVGLFALAMVGVTTAAAQPANKPATAVVPAPAPAPAPVLGQGYVYNPEGRRDPFVSLVDRGSDTRSAAAVRPEGLRGLTVDEIALKGVVLSRGAFVAMIQSPDGKSYTIRAGDRLLDGNVKAVTASAVVFVQQVNDPLSLVKQREVRKPLRPTEEGK